MKLNDEYHWADYTQEYANQINQIQNEDGNDLFITDWYSNPKDEGGIQFVDNLHNNWKELYNTVFKLNPVSVFECGAGGCYHLKNISVLLPDAKIGGADLLQSQIDYGRELSQLPERIHVSQVDLTQPFSMLRKFEFVYSHAVVMHLSTENAKAFMRNMANISSKYIFMVEGVDNHENWYELVKQTLPEYTFELVNNYVPNSILLTRIEK